MPDHSSAHSPADRTVDVAVIGGGAAGLAAALQLVRSRRSVLVIDAGRPRNEPSPHLHAYLGHDGRPPAEFLAIGREEVRRYGGGILDTTVAAIRSHGPGNGFRLGLADRTVVEARRVVYATGLVDELPDIPGLAEHWGRSVLHCPYCHGWEVRDQQIVVLATGPMAAHQALLFRQLSDRVAMVVHDGPGPEDTDRVRLEAMGVSIVEGPVVEVVADPDPGRDAVIGVRIADGSVLDAQAVAVGPRLRPRAELLEPLGIVPVPAPMGMGEMLPTDEKGETSVPGLFAAGNVTDVSGQVLQAASQGSRVGAVVNADLVHDDADRAVAALPGDGPEDWDRRYGQEDQLFSGAVNASLVAEVADLTPGTALDVGCGEGADALWLASRGWDVTAVDISALALERARVAAERAGVSVVWQQADVATEPPEPGRFDLVSVHYPALRHRDDDAAIHALVGAVAPGGTLLIVGHDAAAMKGHHVGFDPDDYVQPPDVVPFLDHGWTIDVDVVRPRVNPPGHDGPDIPDAVLRARRTG